MTRTDGAGRPAPRPQALPLTKLRGLAPATRRALKARRITTCPKLLLAAGPVRPREALARATGIPAADLLVLVRRADMARIDGLGMIFEMMVEDLGVTGVPALAAADPVDLHARLRALNARERIARRSPTRDEVEDWVHQARELPPAAEYQ